MQKKEYVTSKAAVGFRYCTKLFSLEKKYCDADEKSRKDYRQNVVWPLLEEYFAWLKGVHLETGSKLEDAVRYSLNQKQQLMAFLDHGEVPISNNLAENAVRPFVMRRKASVRRSALTVRDGDRDGVDRIEAQRVELLARDGYIQSLASGGVVDGSERLVVEGFHDRQGIAVRVFDRVLIGEAEVLIPEVDVGAGDRRGRVRSGERPRPGRRSALPISDDHLDRMRAEAQFIDRDGDRIYRIPSLFDLPKL